ncbi:hypothetical protein HYQ45_005176 [Verticillium longisporum]
MDRLTSLPTELIILIAKDVSSLNALAALARSYRSMHSIANPILYELSLASGAKLRALKRALVCVVQEDKLDSASTLAAHPAPVPKLPMNIGLLTFSLHSALKFGSLRTASILLGVHANVLSCREINSWTRVRHTGENEWKLGIEGPGSLAAAAGVRYFSPTCEAYASEEDFWIMKKEVVEQILRQLQLRVGTGSPAKRAGRKEEYQDELDSALNAAVGTDAHVADLMELLIGLGANVNRTPKRRYLVRTENVVMRAIMEEDLVLLKEKVSFLAQNGADFSRAQRSADWGEVEVKTAMERLDDKLQDDEQTKDLQIPTTLAAIEYLRFIGASR